MIEEKLDTLFTFNCDKILLSIRIMRLSGKLFFIFRDA